MKKEIFALGKFVYFKKEAIIPESIKKVVTLGTGYYVDMSNGNETLIELDNDAPNWVSNDLLTTEKPS